MDIISKNSIIRIANCIIPRPTDRSIILSVKTMAFNDYSLPGKTFPGDCAIEEFLIDSVKEKTGITIHDFEERIYEIAYEKKGQLFERTVLVVNHCEGVPTTAGDRARYGIGVFRPDITFATDWQTKKDYLLAPGIYKTLLTYYADLQDLSGRYPNHAPLSQDAVGEMCRRFEKL